MGRKYLDPCLVEFILYGPVQPAVDEMFQIGLPRAGVPFLSMSILNGMKDSF
jgi:hypothetical protein